MNRRATTANAIKFAFAIAACIFMMRVTHTLFFLVMALAAIGFSFSGKVGKALAVYAAMLFINTVNLLIIPKYPFTSMLVRLSIMAVSGVIILSTMAKKRIAVVPIGGLFIYLIYSAATAFQGYVPLISLLKIVNAMVFFAVIYWGVRGLGANLDEIAFVRSTVLGIATVIVYGSMATLPFPAVAYVTSMKYAIMSGGIAYANSTFSSDNMNLFAGITMHSQFLGPLLPCVFGVICCDAFVVEKRVDLFHIALLAPIPLLQFMTRSRISFFSFIVFCAMALWFLIPKIKLARQERGRISSIAALGAVLLALMAVVAEVRSHSISRWLRKTQDVSEDTRSLNKALTDSRQGSIQEGLRDFKRSPFFGSGFQVSSQLAEAANLGRLSLFSAPIEKGLLPLMVLGEGGIVGSAIFLGFLATFYSVCIKKRYFSTATLFTVLLATNMAEATFFAVSGGGGILWVLVTLGGCTQDIMSKSIMATGRNPIPLAPYAPSMSPNPRNPM